MSAPLAAGSVSLRLYPHDRPPVEQIAVIRAQAAAADAAGYDGVMVSEHHADFPGYLPNPVQLAGFLLDAMPRAWAAPCPLLLPMKPYALVAEDLAWLAAAHPGRVGAGFAAGALPVDFELAEVPFDEIVPRFKGALPRVVAALRGADGTPLGDDRALRRLEADPLPMVVAAQSPGAVRRAAALDLGILFDSLQTADHSARLVAAYREAGGAGPAIAIRRVWIGDPPADEMAAQMAHYRSYAPDAAMKNWEGDQLVVGGDPVEAADRLMEFLHAAACDTVNVRMPIVGDPEAEHIVVEMLDYTCPHCRHLHHHVHASLERYGNQVAFVVYHAPLSKRCNPHVLRDRPSHKYACDYARLALGVWKLDPTKFTEFHDWLMESKKAPSVFEARQKAMKLVGEKILLDKALKADLFRGFASNSNIVKEVRSGLPLLLTEDGIIRGFPKDEGEWFMFLEELLEIEPRM